MKDEINEIRDYEKHKKRLVSIQKPSAKLAVKEKDKAWRSTFGEFRAKHIKFHINGTVFSEKGG